MASSSSSSSPQEHHDHEVVLNVVENGYSPSPNPSPKLKKKKTKRFMTSASLQYRSKTDIPVPIDCVKQFLTNVHDVILGTKLSFLFLAIPLAIASHYFHFGHAYTFVLSLLALTPLAERVSFLTEQIAFYTGSTVGGLLNATCGNATELIIAIFALFQGKVDVVKYSLLGSILSNLLLVLGTSLFCGGIAHLKKEDKQRYDGTQANVNFLLLFLGLLCHMLPLMLRQTSGTDTLTDSPILQMSRIISIVMLIAYVSYLFFQLRTHREIFEAHEVEDDHVAEAPVIGFASAFAWLVGMTVIIALLSEFVVGTIEDASTSWGISVSFLSIILLPIVGNAAEHAGAIIFAYKDKLDISLGVALGSATQISIFVVPLVVTVAWIGGIRMDLDLNLLETGSLALSIVVTAFTLQDGKSHYMKGLILIFCYIVVAVCFFFVNTPLRNSDSFTMGSLTSSTGSFSV
ncbi:Vacuolar cation/proton exchanger 3 [Ranunculus cassubicifolius]